MDPAGLADSEAISEIIYLYCHAIDRRRWALMDRVFHADAPYRFGEIEGDWRLFVGEARRLVDPLPITHHQVGNIMIRLNGDVADTETYLTAYHVIPAGYPVDMPFPGRGTPYEVVVGARYVDRFERRDGEWRIARRTGLFDWRRDGEIADGGLSLSPPSALGAHGDADPSRVVVEGEGAAAGA